MEVINATSLTILFGELGWDNMNPAEVDEWLLASGISPFAFYAYCEALKNNPSGVEDTSITGISPGELPYIREKLNSWKVLYI